MNILLIEDNKVISKGLLYTFKSNGHTATVCDSCQQAMDKIKAKYDIMIIDVTLPDGNGFDLYKKIKEYNSAPAIFLTAMDDEDSIVKGFDLGAEDYITKPFSSRELLARMKRIARGKASDNVVKVGDISINFSENIVYKNDVKVELTALEIKIFSMLAQNVGKTISRESILEKIWDISENYVNDNTLTVYIKRIRKKLDTDLIKTVKGIGYRLEEK